MASNLSDTVSDTLADNPLPDGVGAVVVAAGSSSRMDGVDKIFAPLAGVPGIVHVLDQLEAFPPLQRVAVVVGAGSVDRCQALVDSRGYRKIVGVCVGGARRQDSVRLGLERLAETSAQHPAAPEWVMVHDGARPCLDQGILQRGLEAARESGAAVAGVPVKDTIKMVSDQGLVTGTPPREGLWAAQTPQVFDFPCCGRPPAMGKRRDRQRHDGGTAGAPGYNVPRQLRKPEGNHSRRPSRCRVDSWTHGQLHRMNRPTVRLPLCDIDPKLNHPKRTRMTSA